MPACPGSHKVVCLNKTRSGVYSAVERGVNGNTHWLINAPVHWSFTDVVLVDSIASSLIGLTTDFFIAVTSNGLIWTYAESLYKC